MRELELGVAVGLGLEEEDSWPGLVILVVVAQARQYTIDLVLKIGPGACESSRKRVSPPNRIHLATVWPPRGSLELVA